MQYCSICESYKIKATLVQDQVKSLQQKVKELQKINDILISTLKSSESNQHWKAKYEALAAQNYELQSKISVIQKHNQKSNEFTTLSFKKYSNAKENVSLNSNHFSHLSKYQTPKSSTRKSSCEKMCNFLSSLKKNKLSNSPVEYKSDRKENSWLKGQKKIQTFSKTQRQLVLKQILKQNVTKGANKGGRSFIEVLVRG